ncbi:hypothetical protein [Brucella grignonensis]|uniref:Uncharacterized protein n=1 Tax=Brucella grignonensis TaxID=94627 RepID=A0A256F7B7_9HYPH|nr:hypothetical protein [Brucella grignonensis]NKB83079.1 hypothetical protein [Brucella grignonensis]OYR10734.1 hypothetical protein CEV33_2199 [Brucella grignonensis]
MTVTAFLSQEHRNEVAGLTLAAIAALTKAAAYLPANTHADTFKDILGNAERTELLDVAFRHLTAHDQTLANALLEVASDQQLESTQRVTESLDSDMAHSAIEVDERAWRACMAEIKAIITAPYNGGAGIGYDPLGEISLALTKHLNVVPGSGAECQSAA